MDDVDRAQATSDRLLAEALARRPALVGPAALVCIECGEPIPEPRRQAAPGCRMCLDCQEDYERRCWP